MNFIHGEIIDVFLRPEPQLGKIRMGRCIKIISIDLLNNPAPGDKVLISDGVAIARVDDPNSRLRSEGG